MLISVENQAKMIKVEPISCPGPCNRGKNANRLHDLGEPVWCRACQRRIRAALTEIDQLCTWLESQADGFASRTGGDGRGGKRGGGSATSPATDLVDTVYSELILMELEWRKIKDLSQNARHGPGRTAYDRALAISFLQAHLAGIMNHTKMIKPLARILSFQVILQHFAHSEPSRKDRPGRCPRCHHVNVLFFDASDELIHCRSCAVVITESEYDHEVVEKPDAAVVAETRRALGLNE